MGRLLSAGAVAFAMIAARAAAGEAVIESMREYMEFSSYEAGIILSQRITKETFNNVLFIDTRDASQLEKETIPRAVNIELREVLRRTDEIPTDKKVILFCNTGNLSAQATSALRVTGRQNAAKLQAGLLGWKKDAAYGSR